MNAELTVKAKQTRATTEKLIRVAHRLFARNGFAGTSIEDIVSAANVTRGALYHHFAGKEALFEAVFLRLQREIGDRLDRGVDPAADPFSRLASGCRAFLVAASERDIRQIVILDAPAVLGLEAWRLADEHHSAGRLRRVLRAVAASRPEPAIDAEALTVQLNGALNDAALWVARASDPERALERAFACFLTLIEPLR